MEIVDVPVDSLIPDPNNARLHSSENISAIKGSLAKFGQHEMIVIDDKNIVLSGNARLQVAKELGWKTVKCLRTPLKTETEKTALKIAMNRAGELANWDMEILGKELLSLQDDDFDIGEIGFDPDEFLDPPAVQGNIDDDEIPEVEENIHGVQRGDIWILGKHRLMCGDSTKKEDVERLMDSQKADMVFTDPPYNVGYDYKTIDDNKSASEYLDFCKNFFALAKDYCVNSVLITPGITNFPMWIRDIESTHYLISWVKENQCSRNYIGATSGFNCWEPILVYRRAHKCIPRDVYNIPIHIQTDTGDHPCPKSIKLVTKVVEDFTDNGESALDLFLGSGSTLIACEKTNRICYGMEIDPHYCSVIIERWQQFTGQKAIKQNS